MQDLSITQEYYICAVNEKGRISDFSTERLVCFVAAGLAEEFGIKLFDASPWIGRTSPSPGPCRQAGSTLPPCTSSWRRRVPCSRKR